MGPGQGATAHSNPAAQDETCSLPRALDQVLDDFAPLDNFEEKVPQEARPGFQPAAAATVDEATPMQFDLGSDYNGCAARHLNPSMPASS